MTHEEKGEGRDGLLPPSPSARASADSSSSDVVADNSNGRYVVQPAAAARRPTASATATHADIELAPRSYNPVGSVPLGSSLGHSGGFGSGPVPAPVRRASPQPHPHHHPHAHLRHGSHEEPLSADEEEQIKMESQISMLLAAASKNNVKRIRGLLNAGVPPSSTDYDQRGALHLACSEGHLEAAQLLIESGADPNAKDRFGSTPLDDAMRSGGADHDHHHHELVEYLLSKDAKHGGLDKHQAKLIEHCAKGELRAVQRLLAKDVDGRPVAGSSNIDPNCQDYSKRTPLHLAVAEGHTEIVALLLANGADPHAMDRWGLTPIAEADRKAARVGADPIKNLLREGGFLPPERESIFSFFSLFFGAWEIMMMILIGLFCEYGHGAGGGQHTPPAADTREEFREVGSEQQLEFSRVYPMFQDVHVMIFVGFGFLMVFLRKHAYTSVGLTFLLGAFVIQWYQLCNGFWACAFTGAWSKIPLGVEQMVLSDFCAGAVLITFGVLLGKVNPSQMLFIAIIETVAFSLNERIGLRMLVDDVGGSMTIHGMGAFFGFGCTWMITPKEALGHENNAANYHSDVMAMIGTIFLWMFWPSFNGALCVANAQERAVLNTFLSLCGSCVTAFLASHIWRRERKFHMVDIQNATLAGGVAMGACADLLIEPGSAIGIGSIAGLVSVLGYVYVQPFLEQRLGLHDTCGVNNLHGMPSLIGGFAGVIAAYTAEADGFGGHLGYGQGQLANSYPARDLGREEPRTASQQAGIQFAYMCTTIGIGLLGGLLAGHFATLKCFKPTDAKDMYLDSEYWEVPHLETPFYFDHRGEIARGPDGTAAAAAAATKAGAAEAGAVAEGAETATGGGGVANLDAPDNARLLDLIQALETRVNQLTRRVGAAGRSSIGSLAALGNGNGAGAGAAATGAAASLPPLPSSEPLTGLSAIPQTHVSKSVVNPVEGGAHYYPASRLSIGMSPIAAAASYAAADGFGGVGLSDVQVEAVDHN